MLRASASHSLYQRKQPMDPNLTVDDDLVNRANGVDMLSPIKFHKLVGEARKVSRYRLRWFNSRDGCLLCRVVRNHHVCNSNPSCCALLVQHKNDIIFEIRHAHYMTNSAYTCVPYRVRKKRDYHIAKHGTIKTF